MRCRRFSFRVGLLIAGLGLPLSQMGFAIMPTVKTVPWVPTNPLVGHETWSGKAITLKGTSSVQGPNFQWTWDFGDGSPVATGTVTNQYDVEATHAYTGATGLTFTARLTVKDTNTGESSSTTYLVAMRDNVLLTWTHVAIDEGLWYLHKTQNRTTVGLTNFGDWAAGSGFATSANYGVTAANINSFEVNGHLESGDPSDPYAETVQRGLRSLFNWLSMSPVSAATNGLGTFVPDGNGNGNAAYVNQSYPFYQGGMFIDALVASGTPSAVAMTGTGPSGTNPGIIGRTYKDIVQDLVDGYEYCQYRGSGGGGWRYTCQDFPDNSACQWAAIGLIAAERNFGISIPQIVKDWNEVWLQSSQDPNNGTFGYQSPDAFPWGPYAVTPSGMVQMVMDGIGRGDPRWDNAETYMRNNFGNSPSAGAATSVKAYYYGMFSFAKALLLHTPNGTPQPITLLQSKTSGVPPVDWFGAQAASGDPTDGIAVTLVNAQNPAGYWSGHNFDSHQYPFETAWAITMLNRTIVNPVPVAIAKATPNPGMVNQTITLDGSGSYHQDPTKTIISWQWDIGNKGTFNATGPVVNTTFPALAQYPVRLRVTDNGNPPLSADTVITVTITTPPIAPTANPGGPYTFCSQSKPWFLDGTHSVDPDQGLSDPGRSGDQIIQYAWDLSGTGKFTDASGPQPDVTAFFTNAGPGNYLIQLRVTDQTSVSFPSSGQPNLSNTASSQVFVRSSCSCITSLAASVTSNGKVQLAWPPTGANHYNVYRSTTSGGPYSFLASTITPNYLDSTVIGNTTYYYVVREVTAAGAETCQSNQASAIPLSDTIPPVTTATVLPAPNPNGWNDSNATVSLSAVDNPGGSGVKQISVSLNGAQTGSSVVTDSTASVAITTEGVITVTYFATDNAGNQEAPKSLTVQIDKTPPTISGQPAPGSCTLWPPNQKMVQVAALTVSDLLSGAVSFNVTGSSNEPQSDSHSPDVLISGTGLQPRTVQVRADRLGTGMGRVYTITANASDAAGNKATSAFTCLVPHDQGN